MPVSIVYDEWGQIVAAVRLSDGAQGVAIGGDGQNVVTVDSEHDLENLIHSHRVDVSQCALVSQPPQRSSSQD